MIVTQPEEFEAFYREHLPFLRLYLARRVDEPSVIADLTADVFLQVIRSATTYRRELGPPGAWLTGIARNVLADHRQSRVREDVQPVSCPAAACWIAIRPTALSSESPLKPTPEPSSPRSPNCPPPCAVLLNSSPLTGSR